MQLSCMTFQKAYQWTHYNQRLKSINVPNCLATINKHQSSLTLWALANTLQFWKMIISWCHRENFYTLTRKCWKGVHSQPIFPVCPWISVHAWWSSKEEWICECDSEPCLASSEKNSVMWESSTSAWVSV